MRITKAEILSLTKVYSDKYGLDSALIAAMVEQESNFDQYACRYEPAFYARYIVPSLEVGHVGHTEAICRATSWGVLQVMGATARDMAFGGPFLSELCDPEVGLNIGCKYLSVIYGKVGNNTRDALLRWNGGSNEAYPDQVMARMPSYS